MNNDIANIMDKIYSMCYFDDNHVKENNNEQCNGNTNKQVNKNIHVV